MPERDMWEVFLTPHTDDETLAMAGAITRAHLAGFKTRVVLVTDNRPSARQQRQFSYPNLGQLRRVEFHRACETLQVDAIEFWEMPEEEMHLAPYEWQERILEHIDALYRRDEIVRIHTVCGEDDIHVEAASATLSHCLCANAASLFAHQNLGAQVSLHGVYVYSKPQDDRTLCGNLRLVRVALSRKEWMRKVEALLCYREGNGSIGYGYKSVPELFDAALLDSGEYELEITNRVAVSA